MGERDAKDQVEAPPEAAIPEPLPPRRRRRIPWLRHLGAGALSLLLLVGSAWLGYRVLFALAGPPMTAPTPEFDPDPAGFASLYDLKITPDGDSVLITWSAQNTGARSWYPSSHHWKPLSDDLPPIPILEEIKPGQTAYVAIRLPGSRTGRVGWELVGLGGAVKDGRLEVEIRP